MGWRINHSRIWKFGDGPVVSQCVFMKLLKIAGILV